MAKNGNWEEAEINFACCDHFLDNFVAFRFSVNGGCLEQFFAIFYF